MASQKPSPLEIRTAVPDTGPSNSTAFPENLPPRPHPVQQSWKDRNCPNMRPLWRVSLRSYNPRHCPDKRTMFRRVAMIYIMFIRTALLALTIVAAPNVAALVIYCILGALGLWFVAACVAAIGDAVGERRVLGTLVGRKSFDGFLYGIAIIQSALIVVWAFSSSGWVDEGTWLAIWLVIFLVAWVASWPPEYPPTNV